MNKKLAARAAESAQLDPNGPPETGMSSVKPSMRTGVSVSRTMAATLSISGAAVSLSRP